MSTGTDGEKSEAELGLALSGGGFRATLFHLGVVLYLRETKQLKHVRYIAGVSGGSILTGHLLTHWNDYVGDDDKKLAAILDHILDFCGTNQRRRLLRRYFSLSRWWFGKHERKWRRQGLKPSTRLAFASLLDDSPAFRIGTTRTSLRDLMTPASRPRFLLLCTDVGTAEGHGREAQVGFSANGLHLSLGDVTSIFDWDGPAEGGAEVTLGEAMATSAAFPGLFTPWEYQKGARQSGDKTRARVHLMDGGILENTGERALLLTTPNQTRLLVSDMSAAFEELPSLTAQGAFAGAKAIERTTTVLTRALRNAFRRDAGTARDVRSVLISPDDEPAALTHETNWAGHVKTTWFSKVGDLRTDLDAFSPVEQRMLVEAGYYAAWRSDPPHSDVQPSALQPLLSRLGMSLQANSMLRRVAGAPPVTDPAKRERGKLATLWHEGLSLLPSAVGAGVRLRLVPLMLVIVVLLGAVGYLGYRVWTTPDAVAGGGPATAASVPSVCPSSDCPPTKSWSTAAPVCSPEDCPVVEPPTCTPARDTSSSENACRAQVSTSTDSGVQACRPGDRLQAQSSVRPALIYVDDSSIEAPVPPFAVFKTEVSRGQWSNLMNYLTLSRCAGHDLDGKYGPGSDCIPDCKAGCGDSPIGSITWDEAACYANRLTTLENRSLGAGNRMTLCYRIKHCPNSGAWIRKSPHPELGSEDERNKIGVEKTILGCSGYRIPSPVEWERAALGGADYDPQAGFVKDSRDPNKKPGMKQVLGVRRVHEGPENGYGLLNILGNMLEWTNEEEREGNQSFYLRSYPLSAVGIRDAVKEKGAQKRRFPIGRPIDLNVGFRLVRTLKAKRRYRHVRECEVPEVPAAPAEAISLEKLHNSSLPPGARWSIETEDGFALEFSHLSMVSNQPGRAVRLLSSKGDYLRLSNRKTGVDSLTTGEPQALTVVREDDVFQICIFKFCAGENGKYLAVLDEGEGKDRHITPAAGLEKPVLSHRRWHIVPVEDSPHVAIYFEPKGAKENRYLVRTDTGYRGEGSPGTVTIGSIGGDPKGERPPLRLGEFQPPIDDSTGKPEENASDSPTYVRRRLARILIGKRRLPFAYKTTAWGRLGGKSSRQREAEHKAVVGGRLCDYLGHGKYLQMTTALRPTPKGVFFFEAGPKREEHVFYQNKAGELVIDLTCERGNLPPR